MFWRSKNQQDVAYWEQDIAGARERLATWQSRVQRERAEATTFYGEGVGLLAESLAERFGISIIQALEGTGIQQGAMLDACRAMTEALTIAQRLLDSPSEVARTLGRQKCAAIEIMMLLYKMRVVAAVAPLRSQRDIAADLAANVASFVRRLVQAAVHAHKSTPPTENTAEDSDRTAIDLALATIGIDTASEDDKTQLCITATRAIVTAIMLRAGVRPREADDDGRFVGGIFAFVASDYITRLVGAEFEMVSSIAVIAMFFDPDTALDGAQLVQEVGSAFNKMVHRDGSKDLQAIGQSIAGWINDPTDARLASLAELFKVCREHIE